MWIPLFYHNRRNHPTLVLQWQTISTQPPVFPAAVMATNGENNNWLSLLHISTSLSISMQILQLEQRPIARRAFTGSSLLFFFSTVASLLINNAARRVIISNSLPRLLRAITSWNTQYNFILPPTPFQTTSASFWTRCLQLANLRLKTF